MRFYHICIIFMAAQDLFEFTSAAVPYPEPLVIAGGYDVFIRLVPSHHSDLQPPHILHGRPISKGRITARVLRCKANQYLNKGMNICKKQRNVLIFINCGNILSFVQWRSKGETGGWSAPGDSLRGVP